MGNRAVITTKNKKIGVYVHWNGGRDSIEAFLKYCELQNFPSPEKDYYGWARLCQVISNFFEGGLSIGIDEYYKLDVDNGDNGTYIIKDWQIIGREHFEGFEQNEHDLEQMLIAIDKAQPKHMQLNEFLNAEEIEPKDLQIGDEVFVYSYRGAYEKFTVIGFGEDRFVNGTYVKDVPYVDKFENNGVYTENPNNYITTEKIRRIKK